MDEEKGDEQIVLFEIFMTEMPHDTLIDEGERVFTSIDTSIGKSNADWNTFPIQ